MTDEHPLVVITEAQERLWDVDTDRLPENSERRIISAIEELDRIFMDLDSDDLRELVDC